MPTVKTKFPAKINPAALTSKLGFRIIGTNKGDMTGMSVSGVGDVNGDQVDDLIIGAPFANHEAGVSYLVFGSPKIGNIGTLMLKELNGLNGLAITGVNSQGGSGWSVSSAGDWNGDGYKDLMIGAPSAGYNASGTCYVVFGDPNIGGDGQFSLSDLNGWNGFNIINSETYVKGLGLSVSSAGDLNNDGYDDIVMMAVAVGMNNTLAGYVVFGSPNMIHSRTYTLSSLNGSNGFNITGIGIGTVAAAGDINGDDIDDLIIGDASALNSDGASYVIFGHPHIGYSGTLALSSLNGSNGFNITGIREDIGGGAVGSSVSGAGDLNGDGIDDLIIGAETVYNGTGAAYVVFGTRDIYATGTLALSHLNGSNGFNLTLSNCLNNDCYLGRSVSRAGDFNKDGFDDIIVGAMEISSSYIVFGAPHIGKTGTIDLANLNGTNGVMVTTPGSYDYNGISVAHAGDINADDIQDIIIGTILAANGRGGGVVIFGDEIASLTRNALTIANGQKVSLTIEDLNATYFNVSRNPSIVFKITNEQNGYFSLLNEHFWVTSFCLADILKGAVTFTSTSGFPPSFDTVLLGDGGFATMLPQPANITFPSVPQDDHLKTVWIITGVSIGVAAIGSLTAYYAKYQCVKNLLNKLQPSECIKKLVQHSVFDIAALTIYLSLCITGDFKEKNRCGSNWFYLAALIVRFTQLVVSLIKTSRAAADTRPEQQQLAKTSRRYFFIQGFNAILLPFGMGFLASNQDLLCMPGKIIAIDVVPYIGALSLSYKMANLSKPDNTTSSKERTEYKVLPSVTSTPRNNFFISCSKLLLESCKSKCSIS